MAKPARNRAMRILKSAGYSVAKFTGRVSEKASVGLFRWATTDHSGVNDILGRMPRMGMLDTLRFIFEIFLVTAAHAIWDGILIYLAIAYGIPYLLFGHIY